MVKRSVVSPQTRNNWLIDVALFLGAVVSSISGIYYLFIPVGGYQGGRNPMYGVTILFQRTTWDDLHTWFGIVMIIAAAVHFIVHWNWIVNMTKRAVQELTRGERRFNRRGRFNVWINIVTGLSFLVTAISGVYLLFVPGGSHGVTDPGFLFSRTTWDLIHTWGGIVMIDVAILHFAIHWGWVLKVTGKMILSLKTVSVQNVTVKPYKGFQS
jgi:hypothetical protein